MERYSPALSQKISLLIGESNWQVPAFLFRFHLVAFQQLEAYRQTNNLPSIAPGRTGDDCVAFQLDSQGRIVRYLYCEAKCTTDHDTHLIDEAHEKVSKAVPVDLPRFIEILAERSDPVSARWCEALQQLWLSGTGNQCERLDLVSYVCGRAPVQKPAWISVDKPHARYVANRRLETVEVHLTDIESLVKSVYCKEDEFRANV